MDNELKEMLKQIKKRESKIYDILITMILVLGWFNLMILFVLIAVKYQ